MKNNDLLVGIQKDKKLTDDHKAKISPDGRVQSEECKRKIGDAHRGKILSEETKQKLSLIVTEYFKTNPHPNAKKVINTITNEIHPSCSDVAKILKINQSFLSQMLNGKRKNKTIYKYL